MTIDSHRTLTVVPVDAAVDAYRRDVKSLRDDMVERFEATNKQFLGLVLEAERREKRSSDALEAHSKQLLAAFLELERRAAARELVRNEREAAVLSQIAAHTAEQVRWQRSASERMAALTTADIQRVHVDTRATLETMVGWFGIRPSTWRLIGASVLAATMSAVMSACLHGVAHAALARPPAASSVDHTTMEIFP